MKQLLAMIQIATIDVQNYSRESSFFSLVRPLTYCTLSVLLRKQRIFLELNTSISSFVNRPPSISLLAKKMKRLALLESQYTPLLSQGLSFDQRSEPPPTPLLALY